MFQRVLFLGHRKLLGKYGVACVARSRRDTCALVPQIPSRRHCLRQAQCGNMQTRPVTLHTQCIRMRCIQRDVSNATYPQPVPERKTAKDNEIRSESASEQPTQKKQKQKDTESECNAQAQAAAASLGEGACHLSHMS